MGTRVVGSLIAVCLLIGGFMYANMQKGDERVELHGEMLGQLETLPDYATHGSLYNGWLDQHHDASFDANYTVERRGGRYGRTVSSFDSNAYLDDLFNSMAGSAAAAGYEEQAAHLRELREGLYLVEYEK
jgi:hypothetical protein